jgi:hypothetical protein
MTRLRAHPTAVCLLFVVLGVLFGNLPALAGIADVDPLHTRSGLAVGGDQPWLPGAETIDPNDGFTAHALGRQATLQLLHGELPWWNPYEGFGTPLAGEMQSAALFPPVLLLRLPGGQLYFHVLLETLAAIGTFLFLRRLAVSRAAATAGGVAFGLCGTYAWLANAVMNPIAFLPWTMLGVELVFDEDPRWRRGGRLLVAGALALSLYAGFPEVAYINGLLVAAWTVLRLVQHRAHLWSRGLSMAGAVALGLALAAPVLGAFADYLPHADLGPHADMFAEAALGPLAQSTSVAPYFLGPIFGFSAADPTLALVGMWGSVGGYFALGGVMLAGLSLCVRRDRAARLVLAGVALLFVARMYGVPRVGRLVNLIPGIPLTAFFRYGAPAVSFAMVTLAAMAIDDLAEGRIRRWVVAVAGALSLVGLALLLRPSLEPLRSWPASGKRAWAAASVAFAVGVVVAVVIAALVRRPAVRRGLLAAIVVVEATVLFLVPQASAQRDVVIDVAVMNFLRHNIGTSAFVGFGTIQPNYGSYYGIRQINVNDLPIPKPFADVVRNRLSPGADAANFTGIAPNPHVPTLLQDFLPRVDSYEDVGVRYAVAHRDEITPDVAATHDLRRVFADEAFEVFELPDPKPYLEPAAAAGCTVEAATFEDAVIDCARPTSVFRRELYLPGWSAAIDGQEVEVRPAGDAFQALEVPAGRHTLTFAYRPPHYGLTVALFVAGLVVAAIEALRLFRDRRGAPSVGPGSTAAGDGPPDDEGSADADPEGAEAAPVPASRSSGERAPAPPG